MKRTLAGRHQEKGESEDMKEKQNELLLQVAERYLYHSDYQTEDPYLAGIAEAMCDIEIDEMWMLTQKSESPLQECMKRTAGRTAPTKEMLKREHWADER